MILQILLLCLGFVFLVKGADFFVNGAAGIAAIYRGIRTARRCLHGCSRRTTERSANRGCRMGQNLPEQLRRLRYHRHGNAGSLHILASRLAEPRHRAPPDDGVTGPTANRWSRRSQPLGPTHQRQRPPSLRVAWLHHH